jgi:hypothetical protein
MLMVYSGAGCQILELEKMWAGSRASIPGSFWLLVCSVNSSRPNKACTRLVGFTPLDGVDSAPEHFLYNDHCPHSPTSR